MLQLLIFITVILSVKSMTVEPSTTTTTSSTTTTGGTSSSATTSSTPTGPEFNRSYLLEQIFDGYDSNESPKIYSNEPTDIKIGMYVLDLYDISDTDMVKY